MDGRRVSAKRGSRQAGRKKLSHMGFGDGVLSVALFRPLAYCLMVSRILFNDFLMNSYFYPKLWWDRKANLKRNVECVMSNENPILQSFVGTRMVCGPSGGPEILSEFQTNLQPKTRRLLAKPEKYELGLGDVCRSIFNGFVF